MPKKKQNTKLSLGELRLISVLWNHGPLTLAEAYRDQPGQLGYTTIQTQLNRLVAKGVVSRTKTRPMKYRALLVPDEAGANLVQVLVDTIGEGSIIPVIARLVSLATLTNEDLLELKRIIAGARPKSARAKAKRS